jgi:hypothetical protein
MHYKIDELDFKNGSEAEQIRNRKIFEDLKEKTLKGIELSEHEKDFFCLGVKLSKKEDGKVEDYSCCGNYKFKQTYLSYFQDLTGNGIHEKVRNAKIYNPGKYEIRKDLAFLDRISIQWLSVVSKTNHSNSLLQEVSKETRSDLKEIENSKGKLFFRKQKEEYLLRKKAVLLQSKYIYCMALQIFELFDNHEFIFNLNSNEIEINEYSIIHILSRHFAKITKSNPDKSFHNEDFEPRYLSKQIGEIFNKIDESKLYQGQSIHKVFFKYKGTIYQVWINKRVKQIKNTGNVPYYRFETFYPLTDLKELEKLESNFEIKKIEDDLYVYIKK